MAPGEHGRLSQFFVPQPQGTSKSGGAKLRPRVDHSIANTGLRPGFQETKGNFLSSLQSALRKYLSFFTSQESSFVENLIPGGAVWQSLETCRHLAHAEPQCRRSVTENRLCRGFLPPRVLQPGVLPRIDSCAPSRTGEDAI